MLSPELNAMLTKKSDIQERIIDLKARRKAIVFYYIIRLGWVVPLTSVSCFYTYITGEQAFAIISLSFWAVSWSFVYFDSLDILSELLDNIEEMNRNKGLLKKVENQIDDWVTR